MPNYNWSEPESNDAITYSNGFGEVVLEPVTDFMLVCRVTILRFSSPDNISAQDQIEAMAPKTSGPFAVY